MFLSFPCCLSCYISFYTVCHHTAAVNHYHYNKVIQSIFCTARYWNPTETLWNALGWCLTAQQQPRTNRSTLIKALREELAQLVPTAPESHFEQYVPTSTQFHRTSRWTYPILKYHLRLSFGILFHEFYSYELESCSICGEFQLALYLI